MRNPGEIWFCRDIHRFWLFFFSVPWFKSMNLFIFYCCLFISMNLPQIHSAIRSSGWTLFIYPCLRSGNQKRRNKFQHTCLTAIYIYIYSYIQIYEYINIYIYTYAHPSLSGVAPISLTEVQTLHNENLYAVAQKFGRPKLGCVVCSLGCIFMTSFPPCGWVGVKGNIRNCAMEPKRNDIFSFQDRR